MNRVVLSGRLEGRPKFAYTPAGVPIATVRILVPRASPGEPASDKVDPVECLVFREKAQQLATLGETGDRLNLEGRLVRDRFHNEQYEPVVGLRVVIDRFYFLDPVAERAAVPAEPPRALPPASVQRQLPAPKPATRKAA